MVGFVWCPTVRVWSSPAGPVDSRPDACHLAVTTWGTPRPRHGL